MTLWICSDERGTLLFRGALPELIGGRWLTYSSPIARLPSDMFPPEKFRQPVEARLVWGAELDRMRDADG